METTKKAKYDDTSIAANKPQKIRRSLTSSRVLNLAETAECRDRNHFIGTLTAGVGSGALSSIIVAPLDLVRTRMQVWGDVSSSSLGLSAQGVFREIYQTEGFRGMFRGLGATLVTVPLFWGVYFPLYDHLKYTATQRNPNLHPSLVHCGSAVATGAVADLICNPLFVVRTRLQTQSLHQLAEHQSIHETTGMVQTGISLYQKHGPTIFWRGMSANLMGLSHVAVQFPVYEYFKQYSRDRKQGQVETPLELLVSSGLAKMCASILTYPHEVLRSRMMDSRAATAPTLRGTAFHIWSKEGVKGFYTGLPITLIRVLPNSCITFLTYELLLRWTKEKLKDSSSSSSSSR
jgi:solute carrier family 25 folate transporter 32